MKLRTGMRLKGIADETQVIVVRTPADEIEVTCGGHPLVPVEQETSGEHAVDSEHAGPTVLGKRYVDDTIGLELLVTKAGHGALFANGAPLDLKTAKPLPASD